MRGVGVRALHGLLDTSTLILLRELDDPSQLPEEPLISAITLVELSVGPLVANTAEERQARQAHLQQAEADFDPLPFDEAAARAFGQVAASLGRAGRKTAARASVHDVFRWADEQASKGPLKGWLPEVWVRVEDRVDGLGLVRLAGPEFED